MQRSTSIFDANQPASTQSKAGGSRVDDIAEDWSDHGFTSAQVQKWCDAGCWEPSSAAELRDAGFSPGVDHMDYVEGCELEGMDAMYAFCNDNITLDLLIWE